MENTSNIWEDGFIRLVNSIYLLNINYKNYLTGYRAKCLTKLQNDLNKQYILKNISTPVYNQLVYMIQLIRDLDNEDSY